jgi:hypothetical protein
LTVRSAAFKEEEIVTPFASIAAVKEEREARC